jgi:hypothetical protein
MLNGGRIELSYAVLAGLEVEEGSETVVNVIAMPGGKSGVIGCVVSGGRGRCDWHVAWMCVGTARSCRRRRDVLDIGGGEGRGRRANFAFFCLQQLYCWNFFGMTGESQQC